MALDTLDKQIAEHERRIAARPKSAHLYPALIGSHMLRARFLSKLDSYERAVELSEAYVELDTRNKNTYLTRAGVHGALHRFPAALADIDKARELGASQGQIDRAQISILAALGDLDRALTLAKSVADKTPTHANLGLLAVLHGQSGDLDYAENTFRAALKAFRSVSPWQFSWLCFQWGRMYEDAGQLVRARHMYEIVYARLPQYAESTGHLAGLLAVAGDPERARPMLLELVANTDDPEYIGLLAEVENQMGNRQRAAELAAQATTSYNRLIDRYPEAFADHAARYFLEMGNNPTRAFELAKRNLRVRQSSSAYALALDSALRSQATEEACALAERVPGIPRISKRALFQAWRAFSACGQHNRAKELAKRLGMD